MNLRTTSSGLLFAALLMASPFSLNAKRLGERKLQCRDEPDFRDSEGVGCDGYNEFPEWCAESPEDFANAEGKSAKDACCKCGGGSAGTNTPPTGTNTPPTGTNTPPTGTNTPPTGTNTPPASASASAWLKAHNDRRQTFHSSNSRTPVLLKWSNSLQENAQKYADFLMERMTASGTCNIDAQKHGLDPSNNVGGENLAANAGSSETPEGVMKGWWDDEVATWSGHFTQAAWRASKYVGCAVGSKDVNGSRCEVHVCRYIKEGNCNGGSLENVLADNSSCGPSCPAEGCF